MVVAKTAVTMIDKIVYITCREHFNAAHRLFRKDFPDKKTPKIFGKCSNPLWHDHYNTLFHTVKVPINPKTSFVMILNKLSSIINEHVISKLDYKSTNREVDFIKKLASTENLAIQIFEVLNIALTKFGNVFVHCIKRQKTENNYVEYFG